VTTEIRRRAGIVALLALLGGALLLALAPSQLAAIRLGGVAVLWWYAAALAPATAVVAFVTVLASRTR
jgi:arginine exporter protein ArgO